MRRVTMTVPTPVMSETLWARGGKRVFDFVAALLLILLLSPVLLSAAALIKLTSRGPLFFKHARAGMGGREFHPFKFRTMTHGRASDAVELVPLEHPDITFIGKVLRRSKIDELPQLFNVLSGDMSLVGPRPDLPEHVAKYSPFRLQRLAVRPGLTGLGQVNGSAQISWDERTRYDVYHIAHCCFTLDMSILAKTVCVVLRGEKRFARRFEDSPYFDPNEPLDFGQ